MLNSPYLIKTIETLDEIGYYYIAFNNPEEYFMISAGDFRNGITFEMDGEVYQIIEFQHVKPGKGAAFVRTKIRNV